MSIRLSNVTLDELPGTVSKPGYGRSALTPGIVHIGCGNFHRAHQAWYIHRLLQQGLNQDWAIIGAGVRPYDEQMRNKLKAQDYLTTLICLDPDSTAAEVIGSMIDYLPVKAGNGPLIEKMAEPGIRIVSLTVTEGGYYQDSATRGFDAAHPDIRHDASHPQSPNTAFGAMVEALRLRRERGIGPFTGQSCDNLQGNGRILRQTVVSLARLSDPELADWIDTHCSFPNAMVDCIVPATGPRELAMTRAFGIDDAAPVTHESFRQWVMEDDFCCGRPEWDKVGATFSANVHEYETMKLRILNAGHQILANAGELLSATTIADCMANPLISAFFHKVETEEIAPFVGPVPGMTPQQYIELIGRRFANPAIVDTTRRVAFDGSSRHVGFLLPILQDALSAGAPVEGLALAEALWARMCQGTREDGSVIEPNDPLWDSLSVSARLARETPRTWIAQKHLYGELGSQERFAAAFERWLTMLWEHGTESALARYAGISVDDGGVPKQAVE